MNWTQTSQNRNKIKVEQTTNQKQHNISCIQAGGRCIIHCVTRMEMTRCRVRLSPSAWTNNSKTSCH